MCIIFAFIIQDKRDFTYSVEEIITSFWHKDKYVLTIPTTVVIFMLCFDFTCFKLHCFFWKL